MDLLKQIASLLTVFFSSRADADARKYRDRLTHLELDIANELAKGQKADDAKVESFARELKVIMKAAEEEMRSEAARAGKA